MLSPHTRGVRSALGFAVARTTHPSSAGALGFAPRMLDNTSGTVSFLEGRGEAELQLVMFLVRGVGVRVYVFIDCGNSD